MNNEKKYVSLTAFGVVMAVFVAVVGWLFLQLNTMQEQVNKATEIRNDMRVDIAVIKSDVAWIRKAIEKENALSGVK